MLAQTIADKDVLVSKMCDDLDKNKHLSDSLRIQEVYKSHFYPYLDQIKKIHVDSVAKSVFYRFQRNCPEFLRILSKMDPGTGDWEILKPEEKPKIVATKSQCAIFDESTKLTYLENNGDKVGVDLKDGIWIDRFVDGTYSRLNFKWINDCEFELEFIESNNETRKNLSKVGDVYSYEIISKEQSHFCNDCLCS